MTSQQQISKMNLSSLSSRLALLLTTEKYTDCSFLIDNTTINCHKLILSSASPVFEAMFYGPLNHEQKLIKIPDINLDVFQLMIEFIYTDQLNIIDIDILMELYLTSEKYLINDLMLKCLNLITINLRYTNILNSINLAVYLNLKPLIHICIKFFQNCCINNNNFSLIINNNHNNIHLTKNTLNLILKLNIKEQNLNLICLIKEWCRIECQLLNLDNTNIDNIKNVIKDLEIPDDIYNDIVDIDTIKISDNSYINSKLAWIPCQRTYYKACKPLIIGDEMEFNTNITCNRFIALKSITINSKLMPMLSLFLPEKYTENLAIEITSSSSSSLQSNNNIDNNNLIYKKKCIILNVEYNSIFDVIFDRTIILSPDIIYYVKITWDNNAIGSEYPRNIFSTCEQRNLCTLNFDKNSNYNFVLQQGSILNGIKYAILNNN